MFFQYKKIAFVLSLVFLSSCGLSSEVSEPRISSDIKVLKLGYTEHPSKPFVSEGLYDLMSEPVDFGLEEIEDYNQELVEVLNGPNIIVKNFYTKTIEIDDGVLFITKKNIEGIGALTIYKLNGDGEIEEEINYKENVLNHRLTDVKLFPSGEVLFYLAEEGNSVLIKCNLEGEVIWRESYVNNIVDVFIKEDNSIITIGEDYNTNRSIVINNIDKDGKILNSKTYGGSKSDFVEKGEYLDGVGLVFTGRTTSFDSEFSDKSYDERVFATEGVAIRRLDADDSYIALVNDDLELLWVNHLYDEEDFINRFFRYESDTLIVRDNYLQIAGRKSSNIETNKVGETFVQRFAFNGDKIFSVKLDNKFYNINQEILDNGNTILSYGYENEGYLTHIDSKGKVINNKESFPYHVNKIIGDKDGGYILTSRRGKGAISQSLLSSIILFDTELIIEKYDKNHSIVWRKVFDDYKGEALDDYIYIMEKN